jgi:voltage-gated potassium channel
MDFALHAVEGGALVAVTLWVQCAGMAILIYLARSYISRSSAGLTAWRAAVLIVRFTALTIVLHLLQTLLWACFYRWHGLPSWEAAFYFSVSSYSTVGSDVSLPKVWRSLGAVESIVGVLMCGMSVSALVVIATKIVAAEERGSEPD